MGSGSGVGEDGVEDGSLESGGEAGEDDVEVVWPMVVVDKGVGV